MYTNLILGNNVDYDSGPYTVIISAETNTAAFNVSINDDDMLEMNETFELSIETTSLPEKVFSGATSRFPSRTTVYILDDDLQGTHC